MNKRSALIFSAGLFLLAVAFFIIFLYNGTGKKEGAIILPQGSAQLTENVDIAQRNNEKVTAATVGASNVQAVIGTLERPAGYELSALVTYYYEDTNKSFTSHLWSNGSIQRGAVTNSDGQIEKNALLTASHIYIWGDESDVYYRGQRDQFTVEDELRMPTYESVLALSADSIKEAKTTNYEGRLCIYVQSEYDSNITRDWYIDIANALLIACDTKDNGELIYSMRCTSLKIGEQDEELFALPSGGVPFNN